MTATVRLTSVWLILSAITIAAWWLAPGPSHATASVAITIAVLAMALVKVRLVIQQFMEVRTAPGWLKLFTDAWLVVLWGTVLVIYLW
ncbi:cytochrome C oxidase subunit IV family protein [Mycobacterium branderi]|uniref:Prokaryotic cytochrome C oxidase subunit IV family protein n=1 Tax=Mycobacterium branderi TaxID=43348 RepID=A0A7I7W4S1_9MYCO|nr:cytochrome C oxidase subunit IV family protein [Mycobacterium branderi]MCV7236041.1 cytochrome C oxidase subunit IV family protein [Mycobacterium branderi]ORA32776.1 prokaryotic cytochrome C oxidase subunit IV family protein [Mycobacterium branderi]BBZ12100.1 prokaryotic cytochrome C oxidase subunit IV family protein [Mycobacterium branderi]